MKYLLAVLLPVFVYAHGTGLSLEKTVGQYQIDVHYPHELVVGTPVWLNIFLSQASNHNISVPFTDLDLSISLDSQPIFTSNITRKIGIATAATVTFPAAGNYTLAVTFNNKDGKMTEASFPIQVEESDHDQKNTPLGITLGKEFFIGTIAGIVISFLFIQYEKLMKRYDE